jgi:hypothetical protein
VAASQDDESNPRVGENFPRPPFAFRQLDAVTGRHQPSREGRSQRHILSYHQNKVPHDLPAAASFLAKVLARLALPPAFGV